jgi:hypothetical protein
MGSYLNPTLRIVLSLLVSVGISAALLATTSPLLQNWMARSSQQSAPYRLYALSNSGSALGLIIYPFAVERFFRLPAQAWLWSVGYGIFLILLLVCAFLQITSTTETSRRNQPFKRKRIPSKNPFYLWMVLSGCASTMLLACTALICQQIAPVPLLWIVPLLLYLLAFIICFDHARWYRRILFHPAYLLLGLLSLWALANYQRVRTLKLVSILCAASFIVCMVCIGELARLKPPPNELSRFYLTISLGGLLGSAFVVLFAPLVFDRYWEFQLALWLTGLLVGIVLLQDKGSWLYKFEAGRVAFAGAAVILVAGSIFFTNQLLAAEGKDNLVPWRTRNFFGVKSVIRVREGMYLMNSHTLHGMQNAEPAQRLEPTMYYGRQSGIGILLDHFPRPATQSAIRMGIIGMGVGTLAAYGKPGDYIRFYELDPAVVNLSRGSRPVFSFMRFSKARAEVVVGDARVKMQEELERGQAQNYDVLVVDAFSGDAIPVHLLTREAFALYIRHLRNEHSVIAFHLTNSTLDLRPVVLSLARDFQFASLEVDLPTAWSPVWVLLGRDSSVFSSAGLLTAGHTVDVEPLAKCWTDDYSSLLELFQHK